MRPRDALLQAAAAASQAQGAPAWPEPCLAAERRFGRPEARLYPLLGQSVRTPAGTGTLVQVFAQSVAVVLDADPSRLRRLPPGTVRPG